MFLCDSEGDATANNGEQQQQEGEGANTQQDGTAAAAVDTPPATQTKTFAKKLVERLANPWRDRRATLSFAIELQAQAAKFLFYVVFFAIVFTYVSIYAMKNDDFAINFRFGILKFRGINRVRNHA